MRNKMPVCWYEIILDPRLRKGEKDEVPQYMLDLYHNHINDPEWISTNFRNKGKWTFANTIRAFDHEGEWVIIWH